MVFDEDSTLGLKEVQKLKGTKQTDRPCMHKQIQKGNIANKRKWVGAPLKYTNKRNIAIIYYHI